VTIPEMVRSREALCRILPVEKPTSDDSLASLLDEIKVPDLIRGQA
jgi:hypothetical protein